MNGSEPLGQAARLDGDIVLTALRKRRYDEFPVGRPFGFGQESDEGCIEIVAPGLFEQLLRRTGIEDSAVVHGDQPVEPLRFVHIGGGRR